jgi:CRP-like cAMP-binding protein
VKLPIETLQQIQQMLNAIPFMKSLNQREVEEMAYQLNQRHFMKDETIIHQGEPGKLFHLVTKGRVGVYRKSLFGRKKIAELGAGDFFGEMALIEDVPRNATVIGTEDGIMYTLSRDAFEKVLLNNPSIGERIKQEASRRRESNKNPSG